MDKLLRLDWTPAYGDGTLQIPSQVSWSPATPLEITLVFGMYPDDPYSVKWVFGRNLISDAVHSLRAGNGDVQVEICSGVLALTLNNGEKEITLTTLAQALVDFVNHTFACVSTEQEISSLPLTDDALALWLET